MGRAFVSRMKTHSCRVKPRHQWGARVLCGRGHLNFDKSIDWDDASFVGRWGDYDFRDLLVRCAGDGYLSP